MIQDKDRPRKVPNYVLRLKFNGLSVIGSINSRWKPLRTFLSVNTVQTADALRCVKAD